MQTSDTDSVPLLSAEQIAAKLGISGRCILNWVYDQIIHAAVHQGKVIRFREVDVMDALEKARRNRDSSGGQAIPADTLNLALWLVAPDVAVPPAWLLIREPTKAEEADASRFAAAYFDALIGLNTQQERRHFVQGVSHAQHMPGKSR